MTAHEAERLEREGWEALASGGDAARAFYERVLDDDAVMLFPGGMRLDDRAAIVKSMGGPPWSRHELEDVRVATPSGDVAVVTYGAVAEREGQAYSALMSSVYVRREDGWRLVLHQQTPR